MADNKLRRQEDAFSGDDAVAICKVLSKWSKSFLNNKTDATKKKTN